jgi:hypothetical protein
MSVHALPDYLSPLKPCCPLLGKGAKPLLPVFSEEQRVVQRSLKVEARGKGQMGRRGDRGFGSGHC